MDFVFSMPCEITLLSSVALAADDVSFFLKAEKVDLSNPRFSVELILWLAFLLRSTVRHPVARLVAVKLGGGP